MATATLAFTAFAACSASDATSGRAGNLGNGIFNYQCQSSSDPTCAAGSSTLPGCDGTGYSYSTSSSTCFPSAVALGGRFRIQYKANSSVGNVGNPSITPVSTDYLSNSGDGIFQALKPGYAGVVVRSTIVSDVIDYTLIRITPIKTIKIQDSEAAGAPPSISIPKGDKPSFKILALGSAQERLAGAVDYTWTTSNAAIVKLGQGSPSASMAIEALAEGTATLTATTGDTVKATIELTVHQ